VPSPRKKNGKHVKKKLRSIAHKQKLAPKQNPFEAGLVKAAAEKKKRLDTAAKKKKEKEDKRQAARTVNWNLVAGLTGERSQDAEERSHAEDAEERSHAEPEPGSTQAEDEPPQERSQDSQAEPGSTQAEDEPPQERSQDSQAEPQPGTSGTSGTTTHATSSGSRPRGRPAKPQQDSLKEARQRKAQLKRYNLKNDVLEANVILHAGVPAVNRSSSRSKTVVRSQSEATRLGPKRSKITSLYRQNICKFYNFYKFVLYPLKLCATLLHCTHTCFKPKESFSKYN